MPYSGGIGWPWACCWWGRAAGAVFYHLLVRAWRRLNRLDAVALPGLSPTGQLALFALFSAACTVFWFRVLKRRMADRGTAGMSREATIGELGTVIQAASAPHGKGRVRFVVPLLEA
ncbi:MAG: hypothetical protein R2864_04480 [Syntrophotaleaceae bacterium]